MVGGNAAKSMDMNTVPNGLITAFGAKEKITTGSKYLYQDWKIGTIQLSGGEIKNCPINLDIKNSVVEVNTTNGIRTLPMAIVSGLIVGYENFDKQVFRNASQYKAEKVQVTGLIEVLIDSQTTLLKNYYSVVKEGSYNAALDMGNNETKLVVKNRYFLYNDGKLVEVLPSNKKFINSLRENSKKEVEKFLDDTGLNVKRQSDLIALCNFINEKNIQL
jgi:hypothetical protein